VLGPLMRVLGFHLMFNIFSMRLYILFWCMHSERSLVFVPFVFFFFSMIPPVALNLFGRSCLLGLRETEVYGLCIWCAQTGKGLKIGLVLLNESSWYMNGLLGVWG